MELLTYIVMALVIITVLVVALVRQKKQNQKLEKLLRHSNEKLERLQVHFGRFTPKEVIEQLTDSDSVFKPTMRSVTVMFADIRGFTKMCEQMNPTDVVNILNGYFRCMSEAIARHHGQVTELIGDGILSLFGALENNPWQVQDAVMAALDMRVALEEYNKELRSKSFPDLAFGIGIHKGPVLAGIMGKFELSKFGVVGDPINVAARVESLTREHQADILITDAIKKELDDRFILKEMPPVKVKGKTHPIKTYSVEKLASKDQA